MAHPLRRDIFRVLTERTACPAEISLALKVEDVSLVSHHTKYLAKMGCAELVDTKPVRGAIAHFYRAVGRSQVDADEWDGYEDGTGLLRDILRVIGDDLKASLAAEMAGTDERFHLTRTVHLFDDQGLEEALVAREECRQKLLEIQARSHARSDSGTRHFSSSEGLFEIPPSDESRS